MNKQGYVYLMTNPSNTLIDAGVTRDRIKQIHPNRQGLLEGFTIKYNVKKWIYDEIFENIQVAIARVKQIKRHSRKKKIE